MNTATSVRVPSEWLAELDRYRRGRLRVDPLIAALAPNMTRAQALRFALARGLMRVVNEGTSIWPRLAQAKGTTTLTVLRTVGLETHLDDVKELLAESGLTPSASELYRGLLYLGIVALRHAIADANTSE